MGKIIVTGATGHIGNVLVRELIERGEKVSCLVLPNEDLLPLKGLDVKLIYADVTDREKVFSIIEENDIVFHLAGIVDIGTTPYEVIFNVNVEGTKNIVDACVEKQAKRLIYTSSVHIIEPKKDIELVEPNEFDENKIVGSYAKTKTIATKYVLDAAGNRGLDAVVVYPAGVIGPYDFKVSELGQVILDYVNKKLLAYVKGGYNFVDVRDVAKALANAKTMGRSGEGYILSGHVVSLKQMLKSINEIINRRRLPPKIALWFVKMFTGISNFYYKVRGKKPVFSAYSLYTLNSNCNFSHQKATSELGFKPRESKESFKDAIDWFKKEKPELIK